MKSKDAELSYWAVYMANVFAPLSIPAHQYDLDGGNFEEDFNCDLQITDMDSLRAYVMMMIAYGDEVIAGRVVSYGDSELRVECVLKTDKPNRFFASIPWKVTDKVIERFAKQRPEIAALKGWPERSEEFAVLLQHRGVC